MAAHVEEFLGGLPEMSNCYCHPGRAGGSPIANSATRQDSDFSHVQRKQAELDARPVLFVDALRGLRNEHMQPDMPLRALAGLQRHHARIH